jgi:hypothetical protein
LTIKFSQGKIAAFVKLSKNFLLSFPKTFGDYFLIWEVMVELTGIEPATSGVQNRRSPDWATAPKTFLLKHFLIRHAALFAQPNLKSEIKMVGLSGFEPLTSRLSGVRSNQLSYRPFYSLYPTG